MLEVYFHQDVYSRLSENMISHAYIIHRCTESIIRDLTVLLDADKPINLVLGIRESKLQELGGSLVGNRYRFRLGNFTREGFDEFYSYFENVVILRLNISMTLSKCMISGVDLTDLQEEEEKNMYTWCVSLDNTRIDLVYNIIDP
jgi:hypothetical protein